MTNENTTKFPPNTIKSCKQLCDLTISDFEAYLVYLSLRGSSNEEWKIYTHANTRKIQPHPNFPLASIINMYLKNEFE